MIKALINRSQVEYFLKGSNPKEHNWVREHKAKRGNVFKDLNVAPPGDLHGGSEYHS